MHADLNASKSNAETSRKLERDRNNSGRYESRKKVPQSGKAISPFSKVSDSAESASNKPAGEFEQANLRPRQADVLRSEDKIQESSKQQLDGLAIGQPKYSEAGK
jgi:hypothetical protein